MILETARLRLRPMAETDLDALAAIASDPQVMAGVGDGRTLSRSATALWIANAAALGEVDATIDPENAASRRVLGKLGFRDVAMEEDENGLPTLRLRRPAEL